MKKAQYNNGIEILTLLVLVENKDGTFDLGTKPDVIKVSSCPACDEPKVGHCKLIAGESPEEQTDPKPKSKKAAETKAE